MNDKIVVIAGLGEVGQPLMEILSRTYECQGVDIEPVSISRPCSVLHVCYPSQIPDFVGTTAAYVDKYRPDLTIINSTLSIGMSAKVAAQASSPVVYSPVRGKHVKMVKDMQLYRKFVGGFDENSTRRAAEHFVGAGFRVSVFPTPAVGELSKLIETTWLGLLIGWAQEIERMAEQCGGSYSDVNAFIKEIAFLPSHIFPGQIGGHCVMPNIELLQGRFSSAFLRAIVESNELKTKACEAELEDKMAAQ